MRAWCGMVLLLLAASVLAQDACNATNTYQTYDQLKACLQSFPLNATVKSGTLATLRSILPSYVFVDSVKDSADQTHIPMSINLAQQLTAIENTDYNNDESLQQAFASLFVQLEDAHTRYTKPLEPYCASSFALPLRFYSRVRGSPLEQQIFLSIDEALLPNYLAVYPDFSTAIDGFQVVNIEGINAVTALGNFANSSVGYSKDYSARFNLAVDGYGGDFLPMFTYRNQSLQGIPSAAAVSLDLLDPSSGAAQTISVDWLGIYDPMFVQLDNVLTMTESSLVGVHQLQFLEEAFKLDFSRDLEEPVGNPDIYYDMVDATTGVLRIYTFAPADRAAFVQTAQEAVCFFNEQGIERLIIDVSQNGGGAICLGYALEEFLFPGLRQSVGAYDLKASPLFQSFAEAAANQACQNITGQLCGVDPEVAGYFTPCAWDDWFSRAQYYDDSWFIPGKRVVRGGVSGDYSTFVTQNCEVEFTRWQPGQIASLDLQPENIILLSDGLCGSTCSVFSRHLQLAHRVKAVTTGGVLGGQQPSLTSFPGGEVVHLKYVRDLAARYGVASSPLVPAPLPTSADFRFAIREIFGWTGIDNDSVPQEFTYLPADFQIFYEQPYQNHSAIWQQVLPLFSQCVPQLPSPCTLANGNGNLDCIQGNRTSTCIVESCFPGYHQVNATACEACPVGLYKSSHGKDSCTPCPYALPSNCQFSLAAATSPNCPYTCTPCEECAAGAEEESQVNSVTMPTWAFSLLLVGVAIVCFCMGGLLATWATIRYSPKVWYKVVHPSHTQVQ